MTTNCNPYEKFLRVEKKTELNISVRHHRNERAVAIINENYLFDSSCPLLSENIELDKRRWTEFYFMAFKLPYILEKKKGDDFFYIISGSDTLKYKLLDMNME
tara:strand:+ start:2178 stop:2486 length:309 start_codon:yes stop_codon:yes gene_type:complete